MSLDHVLLGLCRQPRSGYDIKTVFDQAIRHFWSAELSQIYPALHRLEKRGLLVSDRLPPDKGPQRRVYRTTEAGRRALRAWLEADPTFREERHAFVAQVFFHDEFDDLDATATLVDRLRDGFEHRLRALAAVEAVDPQDPARGIGDLGDDEFHHYLTLRMGRRVAEARVAWCEEALALIEMRRLRG